MSAKWLQKFTGRKQADPQPATSLNWREELRNKKLTREEFCKLCVIAIQEMNPGAILEPVEPPDQYQLIRAQGSPITISFENIWRQSRLDPEVRIDHVERFVRVFSAADDSGTLPDKKSVVPLVKDEHYVNSGRNKQTGELSFMNEHLAGDLWIIYAIDTPDAMKSLGKETASQMNLGLPELRPLAIENLRRILPPIERHGDGPVFMLTAGADYVASLILFDDLWNELKESLDGDIVAAIPSRDVLLYTSSESREGIAQMRGTIEEIMQSGGYLVSNMMLRLTSTGWKAFS